jgi:hypothetical protein
MAHFSFPRVLLTMFFLMSILVSTVTGQGQDIRINRLEINAPWTGFYHSGGVQLWGKSVIHNSSDTPLRGAVVRFEFFDTVGPRETFEQPLETIQAGGTVAVESPQWWDYSGAQMGMSVTVLGQNKKPIATQKTGPKP